MLVINAETIPPRAEKMSVGEDGPNEVHVIDLSTAGVDGLQQFINLFVAHFLAQICQDVSQLTHSDEAGHVFVEDLETATVFFWFARISETSRSVEHFAERVKVEVPSYSLFQISDFSKGRVLSAGTQEITKRVERDTAIAALVVQGKGFFVVCRSHLESEWPSCLVLL